MRPRRTALRRSGEGGAARGGRAGRVLRSAAPGNRRRAARGPTEGERQREEPEVEEAPGAPGRASRSRALPAGDGARGPTTEIGPSAAPIEDLIEDPSTTTSPVPPRRSLPPRPAAVRRGRPLSSGERRSLRRRPRPRRHPPTRRGAASARASLRRTLRHRRRQRRGPRPRLTALPQPPPPETVSPPSKPHDRHAPPRPPPAPSSEAAPQLCRGLSRQPRNPTSKPPDDGLVADTRLRPEREPGRGQRPETPPASRSSDPPLVVAPESRPTDFEPAGRPGLDGEALLRLERPRARRRPDRNRRRALPLPPPTPR